MNKEALAVMWTPPTWEYHDMVTWEDCQQRLGYQGMVTLGSADPWRLSQANPESSNILKSPIHKGLQLLTTAYNPNKYHPFTSIYIHLLLLVIMPIPNFASFPRESSKALGPQRTVSELIPYVVQVRAPRNTTSFHSFGGMIRDERYPNFNLRPSRYPKMGKLMKIGDDFLNIFSEHGWRLRGFSNFCALQVVQEEPLCNDDEFLYSMARWLSCDGSWG
jgi:hypothetical protein